MRGAVRASELRVAGPEASLSISGNGRVEWPMERLGFDPDQFVIDKMAIEDARLSLRDAASDTTLALEGLWFNGDLRSLVGPAKGEGGFTIAGERYGYRLSASRPGRGRQRQGSPRSRSVRSSVCRSRRMARCGWTGMRRASTARSRCPRLRRGERPAAVAVAVPWRASAKVKAAPDHALFEQLEYTYGRG